MTFHYEQHGVVRGQVGLVGVRVAVRSGSLVGMVPEDIGLFPGENVISYLRLFPESSRLVLWGALGENPTLDAVVERLGGLRGLLDVDECVNLRVVRGRFYLTEQRGFGDYIPFGLHAGYRKFEFDSASLRQGDIIVPDAAYPDGYCYVEGFSKECRASAATALSRFPLAQDVAGYLPTARVVLSGDIAHYADAESAVDVLSVAQPDSSVVVGGAPSFCANAPEQGQVVGPPCRACSATDLPEWVGGSDTPPCVSVCGADVRNFDVGQRGSLLSCAGAAQAADIFHVIDDHGFAHHGHAEIVRGCRGRWPSHVERGKSDDLIGPLYIHGCQQGQSNLIIDDPYWAFELQPGETVRGPTFAYTPMSTDGGVVVGCGFACLEFVGTRGALTFRQFSYDAYIRFCHRRLQYAPTSGAGRLAQLTGPSFHFRIGCAAPDRCVSDPATWNDIPGIDVIKSERGMILPLVFGCTVPYPIGACGSLVHFGGMPVSLFHYGLTLDASRLYCNSRGRPSGTDVFTALVTSACAPDVHVMSGIPVYPVLQQSVIVLTDASALNGAGTDELEFVEDLVVGDWSVVLDARARRVVRGKSVD